MKKQLEDVATRVDGLVDAQYVLDHKRMLEALRYLETTGLSAQIRSNVTRILKQGK